MATTMRVGQSLPLSIAYYDQNGDPIDAGSTDVPPAWASNNNTSGALTVDGDGLHATLAASAAGTVTVQVSLSVRGASFSATLDVAIEAVAPPPPDKVLTSIAIIPGTPA